LASEKDAVHKAIGGYYDAVSRSAAEGAAFYGKPTLLVLPNQVTVLAKRAEVEDFLAKLLAGLRPLGYSYSKVVDPRIKLLHPTTAIRAATSRLARVVQGRRKHSAMLAPQPNGPLNDAVAVLG
jgi:hypothetical protein